MQVIHFTRGAADSLWGEGVRGVAFVPLLQGDAATQIGCVHLSSGAVFEQANIERAWAVLVIQGHATLITPCRIELGGGVGIVLDCGERMRLQSDQGAVILVVECVGLEATESAISTPQRIWGQRWPGE